MLLKYEILWLDDHKERYESVKEDIENIIKDSSFEPVIKFIEEIPETSIDYTNFDILFIDYKLKDSHTWLELINAIRSNHLYTEILFYSQDEDFLDSLLEECKKGYLEGIFMSDRENFVNKFQKVFANTIKTVENINALRGLIMAETSDIDHIMREIMQEIEQNWEKSTEMKTVLSSLRESYKKQTDKIYSGTDPLFQDWKHKGKISAHARINAIHKAYPEHKLDEYLPITAKRNNLWHAKNKDRKSLDIDWVEFTIEEAKELRKEIMRYKDIFSGVLSSLKTS